MTCYKFTVPWPPSVNMWTRSFKGRSILTKKGRQYRVDLASHMTALKLNNEGLEGDLEVKMTLNPPTLRRYDIDNFCKSLFDGLTKVGFWNDDEQIVDLHIKKGEKTKGGNVELTVLQR